MGFSTRRHWLVTTALASAPFLFSVSMGYAACAPDPASDGAAVVCSGTDMDGFNSSANELDITIEEGATVDSPGDRAFDLAGTGNSLTNNGDIVGGIRGNFDSSFIVNNGTISFSEFEGIAIKPYYATYTDIGYFSIENNGTIYLLDRSTAFYGSASVVNTGNIIGNAPNTFGIHVGLNSRSPQNQIINSGSIITTATALTVSGSAHVVNSGLLTGVRLYGYSLDPKVPGITFVNEASGIIRTPSQDSYALHAYGNDNVTNYGTIEGNVLVGGGVYRTIGGQIQGTLEFGGKAVLVSLDVEGAPVGISNFVGNSSGRSAGGYTTTGTKSVTFVPLFNLAIFGAEAYGESAHLTVVSENSFETGALRVLGTGTVTNTVNIYHADDVGTFPYDSVEEAIELVDPLTIFENTGNLEAGIGIWSRYGAKSILNSGNITAMAAGIYSRRATGVNVLNEGIIEVDGDPGSRGIWIFDNYQGYQEILPLDQRETSVINTGNILMHSDSATAIHVFTSADENTVSITNSGHIELFGENSTGIMVSSYYSLLASVSNEGAITTHGLWNSALLVSGDHAEINNSGILQNFGAGGSVVNIYSDSPSGLRNTGLISSLGGGSRIVFYCPDFPCQRIDVDYVTEAAVGVNIGRAGHTIINDTTGIIEAEGEGSTAIRVADLAEGTTTIINAGIIRGPEDSTIITDEGDIHLAGAIQGSDAVEVIDNSGVIIGNIDLAGGDDRFILRNLGTVDGDTQGGDDVDTLVIDTDSDTSVDLSRFLSFEAFEKRGNGATELNGDAAFDSVEILGGSLAFGQGSHIVIPALEVTEGVTLTVNGGLATNLTVDANGALDGSGAIDGDVANNGAISPGNSPGILTVGGDYAQGAGGSLTIEIVQSASPLNPTAGVDYDRLAVEGAAALDGTLLFDIAPAIYANGAAYDVITAVDGISGDFATVSGLPTQGFVSFSGTIISDPAVSANADNVYRWTVSRRAYASAALTPNETATATAFTAALGSAYAAPASDTASVLMALDAMSDANARSLFEAANGEAYGSFLTAGQDMSDLFLRTLQSRARSGLAGGWLEGYSAWGNGDGDGNAAGADISLAGAGAGLDVAIGDHALAGVAFGYGSANVDSLRNAATGDGKAWQAALYARLHWQETTFSGVLGYGEIDFDGTRAIVVSPLSRLATANAKTKALYFAAEASRQIRTAGVEVEPFLGLTNTHVKLGGFSESGAGALSLDLEGVTATSTRVYVGAEISLAKESSLLPWLRASYSYQVSNNDRHIAQSFSESGVAFVSDGRAPSGDAVAVAAGITWEATEGVVLTVGYDGLFRGDINYHGATGRLQFIF